MKEKPLPKSKYGSGLVTITGSERNKKAHIFFLRGIWNDIWTYYGDDSEEACNAFIEKFRRTYPKASKTYTDDDILRFGVTLDAK